MRFPKFVVATICLLSVSHVWAGEIPASPIAKAERILLNETFDNDSHTCKTLIPTFSVVAGELKGEQTRDDHGAVGRFYVPMKDFVVDFRFQLVGSTGFNAVFDDQAFKGSHAGHIARVAFTSKQLRLGDDKEGVMKNGIFEMRRNPAQKAEADKMIENQGSKFPIVIEQKRWYQARIELISDRMRVSIDDRPVGYLQSPGLAHATKSSFHFTVSGPGVLFDNLVIASAQATDGSE